MTMSRIRIAIGAAITGVLTLAGLLMLDTSSYAQPSTPPVIVFANCFNIEIINANEVLGSCGITDNTTQPPQKYLQGFNAFIAVDATKASDGRLNSAIADAVAGELVGYVPGLTRDGMFFNQLSR